jgi:hypothetical protein
MLCVYKKDRAKLCTVIDEHKCNDNTEKDVTPSPNQEQICNDVAQGKYQTMINMSNTYEQICVEPQDVWKTVFATIYGTFVSHTMQQGNCNSPATFQRLMTIIFQDFIGRFVHVYLDDIFVYGDSIEEHKEHLRLVFEKLRKAQLYLEESKPGGKCWGDPWNQPSLCPMRNVAVLSSGFHATSLLSCFENHAVLPSYCGRNI